LDLDEVKLMLRDRIELEEEEVSMIGKWRSATGEAFVDWLWLWLLRLLMFALEI